MIRPLLIVLLCFATIASAADPDAPNFKVLGLRDFARYFANQPPPVPTRDQQLVIDLVAIVDEAREAMNPAYSSAKRTTLQRAFLAKTDPVDYPIVLGGNNCPPGPPNPDWPWPCS